MLGNGIFLLLIAMAARAPGEPDPVPHAMVLTAIVVAVSATAVMLVSGMAAAHTDPGIARIWPVVVGATAGFLSFSLVLLACWLSRFGFPR